MEQITLMAKIIMMGVNNDANMSQNVSNYSAESGIFASEVRKTWHFHLWQQRRVTQSWPWINALIA